MPPDDLSPSAGRVLWLDVVRGFALCGVLLANVRPIANAGPPLAAAGAGAVAAWPGLLVDQRFFPLFSLLFGIGFALLAQSAGRRAVRPRLVLGRRLLVLLAVGLAHLSLLWRGDILTVYALAGLVVLLPSTWLPRWAVAVGAVVVTGLSIGLGGGPFTLVPGLFLAGAALVRYGVVEAASRSVTGLGLAALAFAVAAVPLSVWQTRLDIGDPGFGRVFAAAGLAVAGVYLCVVLALLRTACRTALRVVFEPLGRMALTNYLSATVLVLGARAVIGGRAELWGQGTVVAIAASVLVVQWGWSAWWLRRHRQGPLEWLWRWATWGRRPAWRLEPYASGDDGGHRAARRGGRA